MEDVANYVNYHTPPLVDDDVALPDGIVITANDPVAHNVAFCFVDGVRYEAIHVAKLRTGPDGWVDLVFRAGANHVVVVGFVVVFWRDDWPPDPDVLAIFVALQRGRRGFI